jgi:hypothetical protein
MSLAQATVGTQILFKLHKMHVWFSFWTTDGYAFDLISLNHMWSIIAERVYQTSLSDQAIIRCLERRPSGSNLGFFAAITVWPSRVKPSEFLSAAGSFTVVGLRTVLLRTQSLVSAQLVE